MKQDNRKMVGKNRRRGKRRYPTLPCGCEVSVTRPSGKRSGSDGVSTFGDGSKVCLAHVRRFCLTWEEVKMDGSAKG